MLQENIENGADSKDTSVVIYFDGWSFESFDDAKMALIQGIVEKLESNKKFKAAVKEKVQKAAKDAKEKIFSMRTLLWTMKNVVAPIGMAYLSNGTSLIADIANFFRSSFNTEDRKKELAEKLTGEDAENFLTKAFHTHIKPDQFSAIREFREVFAKLINATEKDRIVVLIDDLDRCLPENIISNLEAIKLFLNVEKTAFVIAADQDIVSGAINRQYKDMIDLTNPKNTSRGIGQEYMDKFIQIPYNIPKLSDLEVETYITLLFCQSMLKETDFQKIYEEYQTFINQNKFESFGWSNIKDLHGVKDNKDLVDLVNFIIPLSSSISKCLNRNPRLIKRFLNSFELRSQLLKQNGNFNNTNKFVLLKLMLLEISHFNLFTQLSEWTLADKGHSKNLDELEKADDNSTTLKEFPEWGEKDVKDLLTTTPLFSSVDLREIYWVSRDKLIDGMGGITLIPTKIKELFKKLYSLVDISVNSIEKICNEEVKTLNNNDLESFYELLDDKMLSEPTEKATYIIYFSMIKVKIQSAYDHFIRTFERVVMYAPISICNYLKNLICSNKQDSKLKQIIKRNEKLAAFINSRTKN
jgi:hypothetical protein